MRINILRCLIQHDVKKDCRYLYSCNVGALGEIVFLTCHGCQPLLWATEVFKRANAWNQETKN